MKLSYKGDLQDYCNLADILRDNIGNEKGITFVNGSDEDRFVLYEELYNTVLKVLGSLQSKGIKPGQELVFQIEDNEDFINVFWACILGGIIPVPVTIGANEEHRQKLFKIFNILDEPYLMTSGKIYSKLEAALHEKSMQAAVIQAAYKKIQNRVLFTEEMYADNGQGIIYNSQPEDIAFIQFSSGSTGEPKGVVLTHENLMVNMNAIARCAAIESIDSTLSWMPLTHDLGIIGFHLTPIFTCINQFIMPTLVFMMHPTKWLSKTDQYRISVLASPNFGYKHFLNFFKEENSKCWDLSCVKLIINGAEPISASLCREFFNAMAKYGLKCEAAFPVYGMAEACVAVTFSRVGTGLITVPVNRNCIVVGQQIEVMNSVEEEKTLIFVDLGYPVDDCTVRICDDEDKLLGDNTIGNIHIKGRNVTSGYYNNPKATEQAFSQNGWLRTGDLGFMQGGRLIVTGRKKDIIFINGQNFYPHDIERVAEEVEGLWVGQVAACGLYNKELQAEEIGIFVLYKRNLEKFAKLTAEVKRHVNAVTGIKVSVVVPVDKMPRTTSGKIQRYRLRELFDTGKYSDVLAALLDIAESLQEAETADFPRDELETKIHAIWVEALNLKNIGINDNFFELGGDSLKAAYIANEVFRELNVELSIKYMLEGTTISKLAEHIRNTGKSNYEPIGRAELHQYYPASSAQKRLFALSQINREDMSYNISQAIWIKGSLDKKQLEKACKELVKRHESLRSHFSVIDGELMFSVLEDVEFDLEYLKSEEFTVQETISEFIKPFEIEMLPLFRMRVVEIGKNEHVLILDIHHIIADGTSVGILLDEMIRVYEGNRLEEPKTQYKDYAVWQKKRLADHDMDDKEAFWLKEFEGELPMLELHTDYGRPAFKSSEGDTLRFELDAETSSQISSLARANSVSVFMLLLSAYYILLKKYTGQDDIVIGTSAAGRTHPDLENTVGMFVNTIPLRNYPLGGKTFTDFLKEVKNNSIKAFENQSYQFEMLVDRLGTTRDMSRNPLFDTMFVMQNLRTGDNGKSSITFQRCATNNRTAKFDLTFFVWNTANNFSIEIEYCTRLFKPATIQMLWKHYNNIIKEILCNPQQKLCEITMLSEEELNEVLFKYNQTDEDYTFGNTVVEAFEKQVHLYPGNIAVMHDDRKLTYRELNEKANILAGHLSDKGLGLNTIAAIAADRSIELVTAILAVLKTGGAYVPIDPNYPNERIDYILGNCGAKLLLTQQEYISKTGYKGEILDINDKLLYSGEPCDIKCNNRPEDAAYIIYTSGSTGKPKGVLLEHGNLINYISWAANNYVKGDTLNFPLYTTISFDLTVTSIFTPLITGNSIVIYGDDPKEMLIRSVVRDKRIGIVKATPAHLKLIMDDDNTGSSVKRFIVGGEQLESELASRLHESFGGDLEIYNEYGPTEATVGCMIHLYDKANDTEAAVPIGLPAGNAQIYLLERDRNPVPKSVLGEIYISGKGIAREYIGRGELTAASFLQNPFIKGRRMYKTGDLAIRQPDGKLQYIGRIDRQVKIRGYRIELGEIESKLLMHEMIQQAVVIDRDDNGDRLLAAYYVGKETLTVSKLRAFLLHELPEYMVPSCFVRLEAMPLTINGKVNKAALPEPKEFIVSDKEYVGPVGEIEALLADVWSEVLNVRKIGVNDNYFTLGGDSIKAIQIVSKLRQHKIEISIKDILTYQTIRRCSSNCSIGQQTKSYTQGIVEGRIGFTPISRWFFGQEQPKPNHYNQSIMLRYKDPVDTESLRQAMYLLIQQHDGLRINFDSSRKEFYFNNEHLKSAFMVEVFDISGLPTAVQKVEIEKFGYRFKASFDIESTLLLKCAVIKSSDAQYVLLTAHHLVVDGISLRIILEDLYSYYNALKNGNCMSEIARPKKTAALSDWYQRLIDYSSNQEVSCSSEYWGDMESTDFELPLDLNLTQNDWSNSNRRTVSFELDEAYTTKLIRDSHKAFNTDAKDLLLTAFTGTMKEWTGRSEIVIELESHGRSLDDIDLSRTVGWFTSIYPVKFTLARNEPRERIKAVKEQLRNIPKGGIDYGVLKYLCGEIPENLPRKSSVRFNYLGHFDSEAENELFTYVSMNTGEDVCRSNNMTAVIEINCMIAGGLLSFDLVYNCKAFKEETIQEFTNNYIAELKHIIDYVLSVDDIVFTPSDFDTADINQEELDSLFR
jgi:amino acid adenylation domain-containing protein/non-ribosomal peptide synthase protein (TIGR01720 family)